jgi:hypothetical protein
MKELSAALFATERKFQLIRREKKVLESKGKTIIGYKKEEMFQLEKDRTVNI